jgi:zinc protease
MQFLNGTAQALGKIRVSAATLVVGLGLASALPAEASVTIQEIRAPSGVTAWLVEDYAVPMVTIRFAFEGGSTQDPPGKEGLVELMTGLFDEGAGSRDSAAFQTQLDDAGAEMRFGAGRDAVWGTMRMLADNRDEAFDLLGLAIRSPRFDAGPVERIRAQMLSGVAAGRQDPETVAQLKWARAIYGDHPYARPDDGTEASLAAIGAADLHAMHESLFARGNLHVAVVGAIDAETTRRKIEELFGALPETPRLKPVAHVDWKLGQQLRVAYPLPQTTLQLAYPGLARADPEFYAAYLMNQILGGGTLSSRLFDEVREKRGLAYSVDSSLVTHEFASGLVIGTSTRSDRADEALEVVREVVGRMAREGPTEAELDAARKYVIGSYALSNLDSSRAIAATLVSLQLEGLPIDYIDRRADLIGAVTLDEVRSVAARLLSAEPAIMIVGPSPPGGNPG